MSKLYENVKPCQVSSNISKAVVFKMVLHHCGEQEMRRLLCPILAYLQSDQSVIILMRPDNIRLTFVTPTTDFAIPPS